MDSKFLTNAIVDNQIVLRFNANNLPFVVQNLSSSSVIMPLKCEDQYEFTNTYDDKGSSFEYTEVKTTTKKINKDKIILDLENEILELKRRLKQYEQEA